MPISFHASANKFDTADEAVTWGREKAKKTGYTFIGYRETVIVQHSIIVPSVFEPSLPERLTGQAADFKQRWYNAVWASNDPESPNPPLLTGDYPDGITIVDQPE